MSRRRPSRSRPPDPGLLTQGFPCSPARELSRRYQVPFQLHAHEAQEEDEAVRAKYGETAATLLEERNLLGPGMILHHAITLTDTDIALLAKRGVAVSHNPESNMKLASGTAPVMKYRKAGVSVGIGTDGAHDTASTH